MLTFTPHKDPKAHAGTFSPVEPQQYTALMDALKTSPDVANLIASGLTGSATLKKEVDVTWIYDGNGSVNITIIARHGFAKFAPDKAVFDNMAAEFKSWLGEA